MRWRGSVSTALSHPLRWRQALFEEIRCQVRSAELRGGLRHFIEELLFGVGAEVGVRDFCVRRVWNQRLEIRRSVVGEAEESSGEARIAASFFLRRALEDEHLAGMLARRQRRAQRGVAAADHDHVVQRGDRGAGRIHSTFTPAFSITSFHRACSFAMNSAYSCGDEPTASASSAAKRATSAGLFAAFAASSASRLMIAGGVFAGALSPYHCDVSKPG